jgi:hypothetical protein
MAIRFEHACTDESLEAYQNGSLYPSISPREVAEHAVLQGGEFYDDPSCGLPEAVMFCSKVEFRSDRKPATVLCGDFQRLGVVSFVWPLTHVTLLRSFRKSDGGWRLVQSSTHNYDAVFSLPKDGTMRIDEARNSVHEVSRWNGHEYASSRHWRTVDLWEGKRFVPTPLNSAGEFSGATANCSMATAQKIRVTAASPERQGDHFPIVKLICQSITGMRGTELAFALADAPSVGGTPMLFFRKQANGDWHQFDVEVDASDLQSLAPGGFTTISEGAIPQHKRYRWDGTRFVVTEIP